MQAEPLTVRDVSFSSEYVPVDDGVELRVLHWRPREPSGPPILFVAGWVSVVEGWADLLRSLVPRHEVHYLETREKGSARITRRKLRPSDFGIARISADLSAASAALGLELGSTLVMGSSLGATALLEGLKRGELAPCGAFLIGPTCRFRYPRWGGILLLLPAPTYVVVRHFVIWYLRHFRVDARKEPEQMRRYEQTLRSAKPSRIKLSAVAAGGHEVWPGLDSITCPVAVAHAGSDSLHSQRDIERLVAALPRGESIACESNKYMHSAALARDVELFLERLSTACA